MFKQAIDQTLIRKDNYTPTTNIKRLVALLYNSFAVNMLKISFELNYEN
jgi:hypothetical protein